MSDLTPSSDRNRRILVIDDNRAIHDDFRKILGEPDAIDAALEAAEAELFGSNPGEWFEIDVASQGEEGLRMVSESIAIGRPYAVVFIDMRMPPGWDGIETTRRIWEVCPDSQIVICTAYSDYSWSEIREQIDPGDRLLILKKPFDTIEVLQLANALTEKWRLSRDSQLRLEWFGGMVKERTIELEESQKEAVRLMQEAVRHRENVESAYADLQHEVAERKVLEGRFREQASLLDKARDAILVRDLEHRVTYWNKSAERLYGWPEAESLGRSVDELMYRESDRTDFDRACQRVLRDGEWSGELAHVARGGKELIVEGRWTLVRDDAGEPRAVLEINTDITHQKILETQFLRAQRMESIGTLAGGIAHDLNNVLAPIIMSIDLLKMKLSDERSLALLSTIDASARRGAEMVGQVLSFARGMDGRRVDVPVAEVIRDIEKITCETFPGNIHIRTRIPEGLWHVLGDPTQLHQVFLNLCVNARDAMPDGGAITISAENFQLGEAHASLDIDARPGPYLAIQVEDDGCGIPSEIIDKIFDPFFTTKDIGKGTGLGLSTSLAIVRSHGGFLQVHPAPGGGTLFHIYLPATPLMDVVPPAVMEPRSALPPLPVSSSARQGFQSEQPLER